MHFIHEKAKDWKNPRHGDWNNNPPIRLNKIDMSLQVTVDRMFYYAGQPIKVKVRLDNFKNLKACRGFG